MVDGRRRHGGLVVGGGRYFGGSVKVPVRDLLLPAPRLNTVAPMSHDYYLLSPERPATANCSAEAGQCAAGERGPAGGRAKAGAADASCRLCALHAWR